MFLESRGWWSEADDEAMKARSKKAVLQAFRRAESRKRHELKEMFTDVYGGPEPWNIVRVPSYHASGGLTGSLSTDGAERGAVRAVAEVRRRVGAMEEGVGKVQRRRPRALAEERGLGLL